MSVASHARFVPALIDLAVRLSISMWPGFEPGDHDRVRVALVAGVVGRSAWGYLKNPKWRYKVSRGYD